MSGFLTTRLKCFFKSFQARRISLEDAGKLFKFYRECDEFETWMKEKVSEHARKFYLKSSF